MTDQKPQENGGDENMQRDERTTQNKPSHMNQGNKAFRPDQQREQAPGNCGENQESGQHHEKPSRKAS